MGELPRYFVPSTTSIYEGLVVFFMGEPIPEGPVNVNVTVNTPQQDDELKLCEARCGAKLVKRGVVHECILRRGHGILIPLHICNCGTDWAEVDLQ